jgi:hypothetical protein
LQESDWRRAAPLLTLPLAMYEFSELLIRASQAMGTVLGVANVLGVDPRLVYRWMAGFEHPEAASVEVFLLKLRAAQEAPAPASQHPRRRAYERRLAA